MTTKTITLTFTYAEGADRPDLDISEEGFDGDMNEVTKHLISVVSALAVAADEQKDQQKQAETK